MARKGVFLTGARPDLVPMLVEPSMAPELYVGSDRKVAWRCDKGHVWEASVRSVATGHGCPYCSGQKVLAGFNDLATTHPDIAAELVDSSLAKTVSAGSSRRKLTWRCEHGHIWEASPYVRISGHGCPVCTGRKVVEGVNDLASQRPNLVLQLVNPERDGKLYVRSRKQVRWRCAEGHEWTASVANREKGNGCPVCTNRRVVASVNDLATVYPELAEELVDKSLGSELTAKSTRRVEWECERGHRWFATVQGRVTRGRGCPVCANRVVVSGVNDIATTHPGLAAELVDLELGKQITFGSGQRVAWKCPDCGHIWEISPNQRTSYDLGCPACSTAGTSRMEQELADVVQKLVRDDEVIRRDRLLLDGLELDIVVPARRIAIEFNGCFWHSSAVDYPKDRNAEKHRRCAEAGYQLVTVWEDEWAERPRVVMSALAAKMSALDAAAELLGDADIAAKHSARSMQVAEVPSAQAREFLEMRHIQGAVRATLHLGLFDAGGELRALLSVRSPRANARMHRRSGEWEVQRYATYGIVRGGFSKLLKAAGRVIAEQGLELEQWVSFSANDVSDGGMYETCGFVLDKELASDYKYVGALTDWKRQPKERFQLSRFRSDGGLEYEDGWTEREAAEANGLYRCYDSGKKRWVKNVIS